MCFVYKYSAVSENPEKRDIYFYPLIHMNVHKKTSFLRLVPFVYNPILCGSGSSFGDDPPPLETGLVLMLLFFLYIITAITKAAIINVSNSISIVLLFFTPKSAHPSDQLPGLQFPDRKVHPVYNYQWFHRKSPIPLMYKHQQPY